MNNHHMDYWLDATFLSKLMPILYSKEYGTQKSLSLVLVEFKIIFQSMILLCVPTQHLVFDIVGIPLGYFKHNFRRKKYKYLLIYYKNKIIY
jgi:hypothetical protein